MDIIAWDEQTFVFLNQLGNSTWDQFWLTVTNKQTWIPLYILFLFWIYKSYGFKKTMVILAFAGLLILCTDQISHFYKDILIQRLRPCKTPQLEGLVRLVKENCGGAYGFFSGHATNHAAIAIYLGMIFKKKTFVLPILMIWAGMIAYSRIYIGVHYPLDVLSGYVVGILLGLTFYQLQNNITTKF